MENIHDTSTGDTAKTQLPCFWDEAIEKCEQIMQRYWGPDQIATENRKMDF